MAGGAGGRGLAGFQPASPVSYLLQLVVNQRASPPPAAFQAGFSTNGFIHPLHQDTATPAVLLGIDPPAPT